MTTKLNWLFGIFSVLLLIAGYYEWLPTNVPEVLGFITGVICVWLTAKENIWNFPIGIANSAFFLWTFWQAHLFADSLLQIVYIVLGILGWYWWKFGGANRTELTVQRAHPYEIFGLVLLGIIGTHYMTGYLTSVKDAAPFLDALTTVLSLVATYLLSRKLLENWFVWITADVIYIYLYIVKNLYVTAFTYVVFLVMCVIGLQYWRKTWKKQDGVSSLGNSTLPITVTNI